MRKLYPLVLLSFIIPLIAAMILAIAMPFMPYDPPIASAAETYGAEASNTTGENIGGIDGYTNQINIALADFVVTTEAELLTALSTSVAGDIIYVITTAELDMTGHYNLTLPAGVTLASGRNDGTTDGALIYTNDPNKTSARVFMNIETGARITGLRLRGNDSTVGTSGTEGYCGFVGTGIGLGFEIDNCEIYNWAYLGIASVNQAYANVHHCYIHHCQRNGLGYGILVDNGIASIYANYFDYTRHDIAGSRGVPESSYYAYYNISGENHINVCFDMHGGNDNPAWGFADGPDASVVAGGTIEIHHNTFLDSGWNSVAIRGIPGTSCSVYNNWTYWSAWQYTDAFKQRLENLGMTPYQNMSVYNNWYGEVDPENPPTGTPTTPPSPVTNDESLLVSSSYDWPTHNTCGATAIAMASDGTYWAVYTEWAGADEEDIRAVHFSIDGTVLDDELVAGGGGEQYYPAITIDDQDDLNVVYCDDAPVPDATCYARRDSATGAWDAPVTLTATLSDDGAAIAMDSSGIIHVVYDYTEALTGDHCIGYCYSANDGASFEPNERVSPAFVAGFEFDYYPAIAIGADDTVNVVWQGYGRGANFNDYQIHYRQRDSTATWVNYYEVTEDAPADMFEPSIACDLNYNCHIAWNDATGTYTTNTAAYRTRNLNGTWGSITDPATLATGNEYVRAIGLTTNGSVHLLTEDTSDATIDYLTKTSTVGAWGFTDNITDVTGLNNDVHPVSAWAMCPTIGTLRSNYPVNGFVFVYSRNTTIAQPNAGAGQVRFCVVDYGFGTASPEALDDFVAYSVGCGRIDLSWYDPNSADYYPDSYVVIRGSIYGYPDDPPTDPSVDYSRLIYDKQVSLGTGTISDSGLIAGRTYYYRIWLYDESDDTYVLCGQDIATTNACTDYAPNDAPPGWYQEPTCDMYYETILWPAMNYAIGQYQMPDKYFCMLTTFFMISVCCIASFPLAVVGSSVSPKSMVTPFAIGCALIIATASAGAIPLGISIVGFVCLGGIAVFIWTRV
jgi:hypothetical protein